MSVMIANKPVPGKGTQGLRKGRWSARNQIYHVSTATYRRYPVFLRYAAGRIVVNSLQREDEAGYTETLAFVVMPDHLHWLVRLTGRRSLSVSVNTIKSLSARRVNAASTEVGRVWQKGFHDRAIRREDELVSIARYIVANPLRAGIAKSLREYALWDSVWL